MKNKFTRIIIFVFLFFFISANNVSASAIPDWDIDFIWNGAETTEGGQYSFPLNEEKTSEYGWPEGHTEYQEFYADIYRGTLHNSSLIKEHTLDISSPFQHTDAFVEHSSLWDDNGIMDDFLLKAENTNDPVTLDYIATTNRHD